VFTTAIAKDGNMLTHDTQEQSPQSLGYEVLAFGRFRLDPVQHVLYEGEQAVRLGSRALEILIVLAQRNGQVVSKNDLIGRVWPKSIVQESTLRVHIAALRKVLGDGEHGTRYVENFSGLGYRFVAHVLRLQESFAPMGSSASQTPASQRDSNLPVALNQLIGRTQVVSMLSDDLPRRRLLTIVGPGGIGKTVVASAVAEKLAASYEQGVCFVDLADVKDPHLLASAVANRLELTSQPQEALRRIVNFLRTRSTLLILDNCEHVVEAAAGVAEKILQGAPGVHLLATSREPLRAQSEYVHRLAPLGVPARSAVLTRAEALAFPAVELLIERASANMGAFELPDEDLPVVAEICRRLDGNPLAIELAAARLEHFGVRGLAGRVEEWLRLLTLGRRTALPRHRSLRATLDWSYALLSSAERIVLSRLAGLPGHFDMEAASDVTEDAQIGGTTIVFDTLTSLVSKSLVLREATGERIMYRMPELMRTYALEKLRDNEPTAHASDESVGLPTEAEQDWHNSDAAA
jgi:predicted ATPase/DNA-binding winged helix-turn-helix (wHTH) protein